MHRPKRRESRYHSGRSRDWMKIKNMARPAIKGHQPDSQKPSHDCWLYCVLAPLVLKVYQLPKTMQRLPVYRPDLLCY